MKENVSGCFFLNTVYFKDYRYLRVMGGAISCQLPEGDQLS